MSRRVCLYGELDPYTGSISQINTALPRLVQQLKIACLIYDEVIINSNVIFDHALTLPAFEELTPFIKSGILWMTGVDNRSMSENHIIKRAKYIYGENLNQRISRRGIRNIHITIERWQTIFPPCWNMERKLNQHQVNVTENIKKNILSLTKLSKQALEAKKQLLKLTAYMQDEGVFNRHEMISRLGGMRELLTQNELTKFALIIQGEYMNQGARNTHNCGDVNISLYPSQYIRYLNQHSSLFQAQSLPIELHTIEKIKHILRHSGFSLHRLSLVNSPALFHLAKSPDWRAWRNYILSDNFSIEATKEMRSLKKSFGSLYKILPIILKNIDIPSELNQAEISTPTLFSTPWLSSGVGLLGNISSTIILSKRKQVVKLKLHSRQLKYQEQTLTLEKAETPLLCLIASIGNNGLPIERIKQLDIENDLIKRSSYNHWRSQTHDTEELDIARLNRINVAQCRLNKKLGSVGLRIHVETGDGIWSLISINDGVRVHLTLQGTPWIYCNNGKLNKENISLHRPYKMSKTQLIIWKYLIERDASFVTAQALAIELDTPERTTKQISDIMYKFRKCLHGSPYELLRSFHGEYCLMNLQSGRNALKNQEI